MKATDLKTLREHSIELAANLDRLREMESEAERMTQTLAGTPRAATPNHQRLEDVVLKIVTLRERISEEVFQLQTQKLEAAYEIETRVHQRKTRDILTARYLRSESWSAIATAAQMSRSRVMQLHRQGMHEFGA